jgi:DNA-binding beta-propeller fold protein YncE
MKIQLCKMLTMAALSASVSLVAGAQTIKTSITFTFPTQGIAADPTRNLIYVVAPTNGNAATDNLAIINGNTDVLLGNVAVPTGALFVAVNELTNRIFVAGCNTTVSPSPCTVTVVDGYTDQVIRSIPVTTTPGLGLTGIVANPFYGLVYVANASDNVINVIDGQRLVKQGTIELNGNSPSAIAINPFLNRLYGPFGDDQTAVVDEFTKQILRTTTFGQATAGAAVNVLTGNVFVTDNGSIPGEVGVLDLNGAERASVAVSISPLGVDVDPITNLAFVADNGFNSVSVIKGSTNTVTATVPGVAGASYVAVNFLSQKVYVSGTRGVTVLTEK